MNSLSYLCVMMRSSTYFWFGLYCILTIVLGFIFHPFVSLAMLLIGWLFTPFKLADKIIEYVGDGLLMICEFLFVIPLERLNSWLDQKIDKLTSKKIRNDNRVG